MRSVARTPAAVLAVVVFVAACDDGAGPLVERPNPLAGTALYVPHPSPASEQVEAWRDTRPADAAAIERIAREPVAVWLVDGDPAPEIEAALTGAAATGTVPVFVAYYIPRRDCGEAGAPTESAYAAWIRAVGGALEGTGAVVVIEPDALGHLDCGGVDGAARLRSLRDAVLVLEAAGAVTYLDAGHARWLTVGEAAARLESAGVADADGFSLNVANFIGTEESVDYGQLVAARLGRTGFVIDTGRNGAGPAPDLEWCNPPGRRLGEAPTTDPPYRAVDALLWIKPPGESDGTCNGGPPAGEWWPEYALQLAG